MAPLLRRAATDERAFERLYRRHVRDVYRYSLAVLGEPSDAEDVTQTTFLNAYRAFTRGERPEKPENWLIAIAHNVCRQRFRQQQRRPREVEYEDEIGGVVEPEREGPSVEDLRRAFQQLPPNQREALVMRELEGRPYKEIAQLLGISVSALETLLFRARRTLREQLEEQITCSEAELAISRQLDGRLAAAEKRALRAHLRGCSECSSLAQSQRAQRRALRAIFAVPLPSSLSSFSSLIPHGAEAAAAVGTTGAVGGGVALATKVAAVVAVGTVVGGGAYEGAKHVPPIAKHRTAAKTQPAHTVARPAPPARPAPTRAAVAVPIATPPSASDEKSQSRGGGHERAKLVSRPEHGKGQGADRRHEALDGEHSAVAATREHGPGEQAHSEKGAVPASRETGHHVNGGSANAERPKQVENPSATHEQDAADKKKAKKSKQGDRAEQGRDNGRSHAGSKPDHAKSEHPSNVHAKGSEDRPGVLPVLARPTKPSTEIVVPPPRN